ncbi:MAG: VCBS repeat-containing protein [Chloroflexi bacterium]|nr:VCBS repeat-containing protein [Chloroflexota bacterium]
MAEFIKFTEHLLASGYNYAYGISALDLNGDGHLDIVTADTDVGLYWFENDGRCNFTKHVVHLLKGEWIERHTWGDIDGDGRPEFVGIDNWGGAVYYFDITGDPRDGNAWVRHYIAPLGTLPGAYDVAVADFDGDGALEVAASSWRKGNRYTLYKQQHGQWLTHIIEENIAETRTVVPVDMDGDGKLDILGSATVAGQVMWYENPGSEGDLNPLNRPWKKHLIDEVPLPMLGHPVDMDGDGDVDVVMAGGISSSKEPKDLASGLVVWFENQGTAAHPGPWQRHVICEPFARGFEAVAADLDGDGQMEVVATGREQEGCIVLFKHGGDPRGPWGRQTLKIGWINADSIMIVDIDGDGRQDIVAAAERGSNEVRWWHNEGPVS